jgi:hypothetical protein
MERQAMNSPKPFTERRIETDAKDHAEETRYAVEHGGREKHPEQKQHAERQPSSGHKPEPPWQLD